LITRLRLAFSATLRVHFHFTVSMQCQKVTFADCAVHWTNITRTVLTETHILSRLHVWTTKSCNI